MIVHSILEETAEATAREMARAPEGAGAVEIRADGLRADDVAALVGSRVLPVIATVRSVEDGGRFDGSAEEKRRILDGALSAGASFVDVEVDGPLADLAEGPHADRVILSLHGVPCEPVALARAHDRLRRSRARYLKLVPEAKRAGECAALRALLREGEGRLAAFASGRAGTASRIFALSWGSWGTYGAVARGRETAPGQVTTRDLIDVYRAGAIEEETKRFALVGAPVLESPSPALHAAGYRALGLDAVYVPIECDDLDDALALPWDGLAVTTPLKGVAARRCARLTEDARWGAVNTVRVEANGWNGHNTDVAAARALLTPLGIAAGSTVVIVGAGDSARSLGGMLTEAGAFVTLFARQQARAAAAAGAIGANAAPWSLLACGSWDLLVQATPLGRRGERILPRENLTGRAVLDLAYGPGPTPLVSDARASGLHVIDGPTFLLEQALLQFEVLTGLQAPREVLAAALDAVSGAA
ncbi:MAG TPA: type I 3-dehydroquinate dehydratase [Candidatus Polarisedimenticolaceae bacterium]|nr:type I 3-dehydroquinate dehydratase [Candidatus Polarisedimenticolaceae bacterium]